LDPRFGGGKSATQQREKWGLMSLGNTVTVTIHAPTQGREAGIRGHNAKHIYAKV